LAATLDYILLLFAKTNSTVSLPSYIPLKKKAIVCNFAAQPFPLVSHYSLIFESLGQYHPFSRWIFRLQITVFLLRSKENNFEHHCASLKEDTKMSFTII
jgi:hypothetical protein